MSNGAGRSGNAYWRTVFIGAYAGLTLQLLATYDGAPLGPVDYVALPFAFFFYGLIAVPFVAVGLAVFGLPARALLQRWASHWWMGVVAIFCGGAAGKVLYSAIDQLLFMGQYDFTAGYLELDRQIFLDMGLLYGCPTGFTWWYLQRGAFSDDGGEPD